MGRIKSAWEIALERTENIVVDTEKLKYNDTVAKAKSITSLFINSEDKTFEDTLKSLNDLEDKKAMYEGVITTSLQNINLPNGNEIDGRALKAKQLIDFLSQNQPQVCDLTSQICTFLSQYPEHKKQLIEQLKAQFEPERQQKEAQLRAQYGEEINYTLEQDQEFIQIANKNLEKLAGQYEQTLEGAKEKLRSFFKVK